MESFQNDFSDQYVINKKLFITWKDINDYVIDIHKYILASNFLPHAIVTPYKGGLIPSTILSYHLKINEVHNVRIQNNDVIFSKDIVTLKGKNIVIVDNLIERGDNIMYIMNLLQNLRVSSVLVTALVSKQHSQNVVKPHYAPLLIKASEWAIFPWEELHF